jgi:hypothetical protein
VRFLPSQLLERYLDLLYSVRTFRIFRTVSATVPLFVLISEWRLLGVVLCIRPLLSCPYCLYRISYWNAVHDTVLISSILSVLAVLSVVYQLLERYSRHIACRDLYSVRTGRTIRSVSATGTLFTTCSLS